MPRPSSKDPPRHRVIRRTTEPEPATPRGRIVRRCALRILQDPRHPVYLFSLRADELLLLADVSRLSRDDKGELIGYQRPEVKQHVKNIVEYLNSNQGQVLFPNSVILALSSDAVFRSARGPKVDGDDLAEAGTIELRLPTHGQPKPAWLVDGQQRTMALSQCKRRDLPVPVSAFIADDVEIQREQFLRVNSTKPLPRGLISELLPKVDSTLPARLAARKVPAALCELLNRHPSSPFHGLIKRSSIGRGERVKPVVLDTVLIQVLQDSYTSATGCMFAYRNVATGETDFERIQRLLFAYWHAVRLTWPSAWGKSPTESRLMHGVGLRSMGRLMDRVMSNQNVDAPHLLEQVREELAPLVRHCHWTSGVWDELGGLRWNELQNLPSHLRMLSNHVQRLHLEAQRRGT
jgi:DGQHR domain-containing protein